MKMRNEKMDFYKGMLIIGVILGHTVTALKADAQINIWMCTFLRTFDMPMFAFITGLFLNQSMKKHTSLENLKSKSCHILWPVLLWTVLVNLLTHNLNLYYWYLWSIFVCCVLMILTGAICGNKHQLTPIILIMCCVILHCGVGERLNVGFLFFPCMIGYYSDILKIWEKKIGKIGKVLVIALFGILLYFWKSEYSVWNIGCNILRSSRQEVVLIIFRGCIGLVGSLSMMTLYSILYDVLKKFKVDRINTYIASLGKATLEIYILQTIFIELILGKLVWVLDRYIGKNVFALHPILGGYICAPLIAVISAGVLCMMQKYLKKIPVIGSYLFGLPLGGNKSRRSSENEKTDS